jgi:hypothetical protein
MSCGSALLKPQRLETEGKTSPQIEIQGHFNKNIPEYESLGEVWANKIFWLEC